MTGELRKHADSIGATVNILNGVVQQQPIVMGDPEVAKVQATVIRALRPFPEARAAVVEALDQLAAT